MEVNLPEGYKKTDIGIIPNHWKIKKLKSVIKLMNGFAFKSSYFSENGPIVLTPGNFKLEGGLYFNEKNTKRYSGHCPSAFKFNYADLLIVMTDLTKECNLLGKPAFINSEEEILHNQRIGKVELLNDEASKEFLFYFFLSNQYHLKIKETATGSTVRHTSPTSIYGILIPLPPTIEEQKAIAQSLSDVDALIAVLDQLITKKRNIKQGTMQQLLTGKKRLPGFSGEWVEKELKSVIKLTNGFAFKSEFFSEDGPIVLTPGNFKLEGGLYFNERNTKRYSGNFPSSAQFNYGDLLVVMTDLTKECNLLGKPAFVNLQEKILHNQRIGKVKILNREALKKFLFYFFLSNQYHLKIKESATGSTVRHTSPKSIYAIPILLPPTIEEQQAIAQVLSDMDAEIEALEQKRDKYKAIKQGMMQELLTGKTRLQWNSETKPEKNDTN